MKYFNLKRVVFILFTTTFLYAFVMDKGNSVGLDDCDRLPCLNKTFQVVVHIPEDSIGALNVDTNEIYDKFVELNEYFDSICVSFEICKINIIKNFQYDTLNQPIQKEWSEINTLYREYGRINMFFLSELDIPQMTDCGYATNYGYRYPDSGGIVIKKSCVNPDSKEIPFQIGRYFGLSTTMGAGGELVDGSNCATTGDSICDTPADPGGTAIPPGCRYLMGSKDANGEYYRPHVGNIMSNYDDVCKCQFTCGQYHKFAENYEKYKVLW